MLDLAQHAKASDAPAEDVEVSVLFMPDNVSDWDLVAGYLRFRKEVFIDRKTWALFHHEGCEFEQYDTMQTVYIVAHRGREVLGGARLRRTSWTNGPGRLSYSYMIRDAYLGLLPGMPEDLCFEEPPVHPDIWEMTRMAVVPEPGVATKILETTHAFLVDMCARKCLILGSPAFLRMARRLDWSVTPMGPVTGNGDGRFLAIACEV